jgi:hypothetical protein
LYVPSNGSETGDSFPADDETSLSIQIVRVICGDVLLITYWAWLDVRYFEVVLHG